VADPDARGSREAQRIVRNAVQLARGGSWIARTLRGAEAERELPVGCITL
jgi:hypothetical protein